MEVTPINAPNDNPFLHLMNKYNVNITIISRFKSIPYSTLYNTVHRSLVNCPLYIIVAITDTINHVNTASKSVGTITNELLMAYHKLQNNNLSSKEFIQGATLIKANEKQRNHILNSKSENTQIQKLLQNYGITIYEISTLTNIPYTTIHSQIGRNENIETIKLKILLAITGSINYKMDNVHKRITIGTIINKLLA